MHCLSTQKVQPSQHWRGDRSDQEPRRVPKITKKWMPVCTPHVNRTRPDYIASIVQGSKRFQKLVHKFLACNYQLHFNSFFLHVFVRAAAMNSNILLPKVDQGIKFLNNRYDVISNSMLVYPMFTKTILKLETSLSLHQIESCVQMAPQPAICNCTPFLFCPHITIFNTEQRKRSNKFDSL